MGRALVLLIAIAAAAAGCLTWELTDGYGAMVAQSTEGWVVNPNCECPEPFIIGSR
jgi:hypothetical protein